MTRDEAIEYHNRLTEQTEMDADQATAVVLEFLRLEGTASRNEASGE